MKFKISTFHNIRNFTQNMIPISTAMWDPKWFHNFKDPDHIFKDKRGIYNGLKYLSLVPGITCQNLCRGPEDCGSLPEFCPFLKNYGQQLEKIDFNQMISELENIALAIQQHEKFEEEPIIVLLVYEKPDNPCSERQELKKLFQLHGIDLEEV